MSCAPDATGDAGVKWGYVGERDNWNSASAASNSDLRYLEKDGTGAWARLRPAPKMHDARGWRSPTCRMRVCCPEWEGAHEILGAKSSGKMGAVILCGQAKEKGN